MVTVAQLVERRIVIPVVVGSIPISHPIFPLFINKASAYKDSSRCYISGWKILAFVMGAPTY